MVDRPQTVGQLRESGYRPQSVKDEMRKNLIRKLRSGENLFPGIVGYEETVTPQIVNAILSRHDMLFLGLRGQGKTRILRSLTSLLDDALPIVAGSEIHDDPLAPLSKYARDRITVEGDNCPIDYVGASDRYFEKLATPDVTIADLIGEIDLVKHASGKELASEDVLHFGLIPRAHRGIFCMNEVPDLSPKIQVGLFNVLEERDIQIRGFPIRLNLDVCIVFSANPEDYTNRGRIVTPLKDRIGSVIRTHYPLTRELGMSITDQNAWTDRDSSTQVIVPTFLKEIVEETARLARQSPHVNQASGVSVRMSIANYENLVSNAERRAIVQHEKLAVARTCDLNSMVSSSRGKLELSMSDESGEEDKLLGRIIDEATKNIFDQHFNPKQFRNVVEHFDLGESIELGDGLSSEETWQKLSAIRGFSEQVEAAAKKLEPTLLEGATRTPVLASVAEFLLDGLYCSNRLSRQPRGTGLHYGK